jgi:hypothetical protein
MCPITSYINTNHLVENQDNTTKKHTINQLLTNDPNFPVAKGKNEKAITSAVKKFYQELTTKLSDKAKKVTQAGEDGSEDDDAGPGAAPTRRTGRSRLSRGGAASGSASDGDGGDDNGDQDAGGDTAPVGRRRSGRLAQGSSPAKKRARASTPEGEVEDVQPAPKKKKARKTVVPDDEDEE